MALLVSVISIACLFISDSELVFYTGYVLMIVTGLLLIVSVLTPRIVSIVREARRVPAPSTPA